jgi:hypothetical protein
MIQKCNTCYRKILDIDQTDPRVVKILIDCVNCYMDPVIHYVKYSTIVEWLTNGTPTTETPNSDPEPSSKQSKNYFKE